MRNTILKLILVLGRYAVIPAVAVALVVFPAWLIALDQRLALVLLLLSYSVTNATRRSTNCGVTRNPLGWRKRRPLSFLP
jgi:hypothetical protein